MYFITFTVVGGIDVFVRIWDKKIIVNSLSYCINKKGTHTDHASTSLSTSLGSITEVTDQQAILQQRMIYNAWGVRELIYNNPNSGYTNFMFDRGYTGHEHLDAFKLINMNGRLYDPLLGRMLSPDNFVQNSTNSQNFNRYSYCLNNPLVYNDLSGEFLFPIIAAVLLVGGYMHYTGHTSSQVFHASTTAALMVASFGFGNLITGSGIAFANTASIIGGSAAFSDGQFISNS